MTYEVEIRFVVDTPEEAFSTLPFLEESLRSPKSWATEIIGEAIFKDGRLLRIGQVIGDAEERRYMGYKGPDLGTFANIREEWDEEVTGGVQESEILAAVGLSGSFDSVDAVLAALDKAGHRPFMGFAGVDQLGFYAPLAVHTKLCHCEAIVDDGVLIELEMAARTLEEAKAAEVTLQEIAQEYNIVERLDPDEPPTMLYKRKFPYSRPIGTPDLSK